MSRPRQLRAVLTRDPLGRRRDRWFWALRDVDLEVGAGEAVALIGRNGAGKSTLLRLLGGVGRPSRGTVRVGGRIASLIDPGHEFHVDLTGRQNAELAGVVAGLTRREFHDRYDEIVAFAELTEFMDEPLRAFSDGMRARLAFSVMAHVEPDVLLVDEVLAVGDAAFQRRSVERIEQLRNGGTAVVFVSHDLALARTVCDAALWLDHGDVRARGPAADVVRQYLDAVSVETPSGSTVPAERNGLRGVRMLDRWGAPVVSEGVGVGDGLTVAVDLDLPEDSLARHVRVRLVRVSTGVMAVDTSTDVRPGSRGTFEVHFDRLDLAPGDHRCEVHLFTSSWAHVVDEAQAIRLVVRGEGPATAALAPPHHWRKPLPPRAEP